MLKVVNDKGFQMTFENGYTISVMFGRGNYSSNRFNEGVPQMGEASRAGATIESDSAEICVWDENGDTALDTDCGGVLGWVSTDEVASWINKVRGWI